MKITVFTPTYNRAHTLPVLYHALQQQTFRDFEWLVVDDGSTDESPALLAKMQAEGTIDMRTMHTANGGKHRAINLGVREARGELFFIVDSDDSLPPDALAALAEQWDAVRADDSFCGVSGMRIHFDGRKIGAPVAWQTLDCTYLECRTKHKVTGDMAEAWRTDVMRQFPFPEYPGEKFVSEGLVWARMSNKYRVRFFNRGIYLCEYLPDGLTHSIRRVYRESPLGAMEFFAAEVRRSNGGWLPRVKSAINYWRYTIGYRGRRVNKLPFWGYLFLPVGAFFRWRDIKSARH